MGEFEGYSCKFSPFEANRLACVFSQYYGIVGNGRLSVFNQNPLTGVLEENFRFNTNDGLFDLAWSEANENHIVTAGGDGTIKLWDMGHKLPVLSIKEHNGEAYSVAWNHSVTNLVISGGMDTTVRLYDIQKGMPLATFPGHKQVVYNVTWHPTMNNVLASTSADRSVKLWDTKSGTCIKTILAHNAEVMNCDFNKYENILASSGADGTINIFDLRGSGDIPMQTLNGHFLTTRRVVFSPFFSSILASVSYDMNVMIWDIKKSMPLNTFKHHREFVLGVDFSLFDNKKIATTGWDRSLYVFNWDEMFKS
jgi:peroxin-7